MFDRKELKAAAKQQIKGNIGKLFLCSLVAIVLIIVLYVVLGGIAMTSAMAGNWAIFVVIYTIIGCVSVIIGPPLAASFVKIFLNMREGQSPAVSDIFYAYKTNLTGKSIWLAIIMGFFIYLWTLLLIIPGIIKSYAYSLAFWYLVDNEGMTAREALRMSKKATRGYKGKLFVLDLSFIGWGLLVSITFGIAGIWVFPYIYQTYTNAYKQISENYAKDNPMD